MLDFMTHDFMIGNIELACLVKAGTGSNVHRNRPSHGLAIFLGGDNLICFDDRKIKVSKNMLVYFPKGSNYTIKIKEAADCYAINFQMADDASFEPFALKIKNPNSVIESFEQSRKIWSKKRPGYSAKVKAELYNILYNMQTEFHIPYGNSTVIQPAVDYIHANYDKAPITVSYLASICQISTVHLRNTFIKNFAVPPIKYINNLKLSRVQELLASQMYTVTEACFLSGFQDESYFCREFKKHFHVPPSEYAKGPAAK